MTPRPAPIDAPLRDLLPRDPRLVDAAPANIPPANGQPDVAQSARKVAAVVAVLSLAVFMSSLDLSSSEPLCRRRWLRRWPRLHCVVGEAGRARGAADRRTCY